MTIKLFASDLDGTLLNADHEWDDRIRAGIKSLQDQGYIVSTATGRGGPMLDRGGLPKMMHVVMNGAAILDENKNLLTGFPIDPQIIKDLYEAFPYIPLEFNALDKVYSTQKKEDLQKRFIENAPEDQDHPPKAFSDDEFYKIFDFECTLDQILAQPVYKINCHHPKGHRYTELDDYCKDHTDILTDAPCEPWLSEITAAGVSKAEGVRALGAYFGIAPDEIAVFGDAGNDLVMLEEFENSYSPCSASDEAKALAKHIIGPFEEYSVIDKMLEIAESQKQEGEKA